MLLVHGFSEGDHEFAACIPSDSVNPKHETLVGVLPFIERPHEADASLDSHNAARPSDFLRA
jgi:hypothetical protein